MTRAPIVVRCALVAFLTVLALSRAVAQTPSPRVSGQISVHLNTASRNLEGIGSRADAELSTSAVLETIGADSRLEFGLDVRDGRWLAGGRPNRVSVYNGFVGARFGGMVGVRVRAGHMWLPDLGTMGALAGGLVEMDRRPSVEGTRVRVGAFSGLEPNFFDLGYVPDVRKHGAYAAVERGYQQRHVVGVTVVRQESLTERAVLATTNFVPVGRAAFVYQAAEFEIRGPAQGAAQPGLSYLLTNVRVNPAPRVELLGTYNRGRSLDARRLTEDLLNHRALTARDVEGLRYEGGGGRVTIEPFRSVYAYVGYARDRTNRDDASTGRVTIGGHAGNVLRSGVDASFSDAWVNSSTGPYHSRYISIGRSVSRTVYATVDYSTSLSVLRFERSDGLAIETRPWTRRFSASGSVALGPQMSLLCTVDRTVDEAVRELRMLAGLSYRFR